MRMCSILLTVAVFGVGALFGATAAADGPGTPQTLPPPVTVGPQSPLVFVDYNLLAASGKGLGSGWAEALRAALSSVAHPVGPGSTYAEAPQVGGVTRSMPFVLPESSESLGGFEEDGVRLTPVMMDVVASVGTAGLPPNSLVLGLQVALPWVVP